MPTKFSQLRHFFITINEWSVIDISSDSFLGCSCLLGNTFVKPGRNEIRHYGDMEDLRRNNILTITVKGLPSKRHYFLLYPPDALYPKYPGFGISDCHPGKEKLTHDFAMLVLRVSWSKLNYLWRILSIKIRVERKWHLRHFRNELSSQSKSDPSAFRFRCLHRISKLSLLFLVFLTLHFALGCSELATLDIFLLRTLGTGVSGPWQLDGAGEQVSKRALLSKTSIGSDSQAGHRQ